MSRIFLSHSSFDDLEAIALRDWLAAQGWDDIFLDLDPERGIAAGERWERALHAAALRCEAVVFLVSRNWLASLWCLKEYSLARGLNKKLFAVLIDPEKKIAELPQELKGTWQIVDLTGGEVEVFRAVRPGSHEEKHVGFSGEGLRRLRRGLEKAGLDAKFFAWPPAGEPGRAPYRGLKAMEAEDAGVFFGRDAAIVEALDRLRGLREAAAPRLLVLLGASGAGKSSFLRAGLFPRLARDDRTFLPLPPIRPARAALFGETGLLRALEAVLPARTRADLRAAIQAGAAGLLPLLEERVATALAQRVGEDDACAPAVVIAIDQAEELFRAEGASETAALLDLLRALSLAESVKIIVLFAIRSDAYDALERAKSLEGLPQATLPLLPISHGAYKEVIEGPQRRVSETGGRLAIEPRLTLRLLDDIAKGGADALPLLAFALEQLYLDYNKSGALTLAHYEALGGFAGAIDAAVTRAFARADEGPRIPRDSTAREKLLRRGLIPWLAGVDPETRAPRRNIARRSDIPPEAAPLVDLLVEERLLATGAREEPDETGAITRVATIEPTHEALLRQWGLLKGWLEEDFPRLVALEGVKRAARDWDANARNEAWAAHSGLRFVEADALDERPDLAEKLDATDRAYLAACRAKENVERTRELALAAAERRAAQRTRTGLAVAIALTVAFLVAAGFGFFQANEATQRTMIAKRSQMEAEQQKMKVEQRSALLAANVARSLTEEGSLDPALLLMLESARVFDDKTAPDEIRIAFTRALEKKERIETRTLFPNMRVFETDAALLLVDPATNDIWKLTDSIDPKRLVAGAPGDGAIATLMQSRNGKNYVVVRETLEVELIDAATGSRRKIGAFPKSKKGTEEVYSDETTQTEDGLVIRVVNFGEGKLRDDRSYWHFQTIDTWTGREFEWEHPEYMKPMRKSPNGGIYALDAEEKWIEIKNGTKGIVVSKAKISESDAFRAKFGNCVADMPPPAKTAALNDRKESITVPTATISCKKFNDKFLFTFVTSGSGGEFPEDELIRSNGTKVDIRQTLEKLAPGKIPRNNIAWIGSRSDSERIALVVNRNVYVLGINRLEDESFDSAIERGEWSLLLDYRHPTMVEHARLIGPGQLAVIEAASGRIVVHHFGADRDGRILRASNTKLVGSDAAIEMLHQINRDGYLSEMAKHTALPDGRNITFVESADALSLHVGDEAGITLKFLGKAPVLQFSRDWKKLLATGDEGISIYDFSGVLRSGSLAENKIGFIPLENVGSAFFVDAPGETIVTTNWTNQVLLWKISPNDKSWSNDELYRGDYKISYAEPDTDGKRLLISEWLSGSMVHGSVLALPSRQLWFDLGLTYKWFGATFTKDSEIVVEEAGKWKRAFSMFSLSTLATLADKELSPECRPVNNDDYRSSPCWPAAYR
jgi:hypothetical protein